jgi:hypothetical protein
MYSREFETVNVDSVKNIMTTLGHSHIDLLKMDIEGAEIVALTQMLADGVHPKYLCVEFDLFLKGRDNENKTSQIISKLQTAGYKMVENDGWNCLFVLNS